MSFPWFRNIRANNDRRRADRHLETLLATLHRENETAPFHIIERSETGCIGTTSAALRHGEVVRVAYADDSSQLMTVVRCEHGISALKYMSAAVR
jgi:hypothetical protein